MSLPFTQVDNARTILEAYPELKRASRKRMAKLMDKGRSLEEAYWLETATCPDCGRGACGCGAEDLPYVKRDHYLCMHSQNECSMKVADQIYEDEMKKRDEKEQEEINLKAAHDSREHLKKIQGGELETKE